MIHKCDKCGKDCLSARTELIKEIRDKMPKKELRAGETIEWSDGYLTCLSEFESILNDL